MPSLVANESVWRGFRRMAGGMSGTVKSYLLKTAGLTAHDIRLFPGKRGPFWMQETSGYSEFPWYARFNPTLCVGDIYILNASGTSPVIIEEHVLLKIPKDFPISVNITGTDSATGPKTPQKFANFRVSMLESLPEETAVSNLQPLNTGVVVRAPAERCAFSLTFDFLDKSDIQGASNDATYSPKPEVVDKTLDALSRFMSECELSYGLV